MDRIRSAIINDRELIINGTNMKTDEYGRRYRVYVTSDKMVQLKYWGNQVAEIDKVHGHITLWSCNYRTKSTLKLLNEALRAFRIQFQGPEMSIYSSHGRWVVRYGDDMVNSDWNGDGLTLM
jgi:hypothetical protein